MKRCLNCNDLGKSGTTNIQSPVSRGVPKGRTSIPCLIILGEIRKAIYAANAIESLTSIFRKAIKKGNLFTSDESARKMVYLAIIETSKKWSVPIHNWHQAMVSFIIEFGDRLEKQIN